MKKIALAISAIIMIAGIAITTVCLPDNRF
jgi:hypothetical protein